VLGLGWFPDQPGGLTRYLRGLMDAMAEGNVDPPRAVVIGPVAEPLPAVEPVSSPDRPLLFRLVRFALATRRQAARADLVDSHYALYTYPCTLLPRVRRLPMVVHFHGPWASEFVANGAPDDLRISVKRWVERQVYRRAAAVIVLSAAFKRVVVDEFAIDPSRVHVMGPGVDLATFSPGDRRQARLALDVRPSAWVAVTTRRLDARMGIDVILRAWAELDGDDRLLMVVGDGPERGALESLASALGIADHVRFLGRVSDEVLVSCYRAADVSVVPSLALEGFGLVVVEALACGTPVVGTDVGGMQETLERFDPGLIVPAGDASALVTRLADARTGARPLPSASQCRQYAETFSWSEVARRHWQLYAGLIASEGGRWSGPQIGQGP